MKNLGLFAIGVLALCGVAEAVILLQVHPDPVRLGAILLSLGLILCAFVGLAQQSLVRHLRQRVVESVWAAATLPLLLLIPYLVYAFGTRSFTFLGAGKLLAYILAPGLLLLPDRLHRPPLIGWRDVAAMLALALPVAANWLTGIWTWPFDLYFFRPLFCVCVGVYAFAVVRNLEGVGYRLIWHKQDVTDGTANFLGFVSSASRWGCCCISSTPTSQTPRSGSSRFSSLPSTSRLPFRRNCCSGGSCKISCAKAYGEDRAASTAC